MRGAASEEHARHVSNSNHDGEMQQRRPAIGPIRQQTNRRRKHLERAASSEDLELSALLAGALEVDDK